MALELEFEGQLRALAIKRFDGDGSDGTDRAVHASKYAFMRSLVLGDLVADVPCSAGQPPFVCCSAANPRRSVCLDVGAHDLLLPLAVLGQVFVVREDVRGLPVNLDAVNDRRHLGSPHWVWVAGGRPLD